MFTDISALNTAITWFSTDHEQTTLYSDWCNGWLTGPLRRKKQKEILSFPWRRVATWLGGGPTIRLGSQIIKWNPKFLRFEQLWAEPPTLEVDKSNKAVFINWSVTLYQVFPTLLIGSQYYTPECMSKEKYAQRWAARLTKAEPRKANEVRLGTFIGGVNKNILPYEVSYWTRVQKEEKKPLRDYPCNSMTLGAWFRYLGWKGSEQVLQRVVDYLNEWLTRSSYLDPAYTFKEFTGWDIVTEYKRGHFDSCMTGSRAEATGFYAVNPDKVSLLLGYKNHRDRFRCLLWTLPDGSKFIDRLYGNDDHYEIQQAKLWLSEQYPNSSVLSKYSQADKSRAAKRPIRMNMQESYVVPYVDTFCYWDTSQVNDGVVYISCNNEFGDYVAQDYENGGPFHGGDYSGGHMVCCGCDDYIEEDEGIYSDWHEATFCEYCFNDSCIWTETVDGDIPSRYAHYTVVPMEAVGFSTYTESEVWIDTSQYCDLLDTVIPDSVPMGDTEEDGLAPIDWLIDEGWTEVDGVWYEQEPEEVEAE